MSRDIHPVSDDALQHLQQTVDRVLERLDVVVRLEERQDGLNRRQDRAETRLDGHGQRLLQIEKEAIGSGRSAAMVERVMWIGLSACIGLLTYFLRT